MVQSHQFLCAAKRSGLEVIPLYYRTLNQAMRERFGCKVYKLALDGGMTCPNRDGTLDTRGCIFCDADGAGAFAAAHCGEITAQLADAKRRVAAKLKGEAKYIAYFQSFTNTYAPPDRLEALFLPVLQQPEIVALSIATRPDCLPDPVLALLKRLCAMKPVWVELGLQTIHPQTADNIRRGYALPVYDAAVRNLKKIGVEVISHMILGLPGESPDMIWQTAEYIGRSGADGIKLHLLHVLEGTDLATAYRSGAFETLTLEEYIAILEGCIRRIPPDMVIHRMTGDGAKANLIAPLWSGDKKRVLNAIHAAFVRDDVVQGAALGFRNPDGNREKWEQ